MLRTGLALLILTLCSGALADEVRLQGTYEIKKIVFAAEGKERSGAQLSQRIKGKGQIDQRMLMRFTENKIAMVVQMMLDGKMTCDVDVVVPLQWDSTGFSVANEAEAHAKSIVYGQNKSGANAYCNVFIVKGHRRVKVNADQSIELTDEAGNRETLVPADETPPWQQARR